MKFTELSLKGCFKFEPRLFRDSRGTFVKTLITSELKKNGLQTNFVEQYHTTSSIGVIRGMHFQKPPHDHVKIVYCAWGAVNDVLLDLRKLSPTYGQAIKLKLTAESGIALYLAPGVAHGFIATEEPALMIYNVTTEYVPSHDTGIRWDSFGFDWGTIQSVTSERDKKFPTLAEFKTPFNFS